MRAYPLGDKAERVADMIRHREGDRLVQKRYWAGGRGCAIGCQIHSDDHTEHARVFGIDEKLSWLQDHIFENLPLAEALEWPVRFLEAIPEGADTSEVWPQFAARLLTRCIDYIGNGNERWRLACHKAVTRVRDLSAAGAKVSLSEVYAARDAAGSCATGDVAAWSGCSDQARAARSAAWAAWNAALATTKDVGKRAVEASRDASRAAAQAALWREAAQGTTHAEAEDTALVSEIRAQRDDLLELLRQCS